MPLGLVAQTNLATKRKGTVREHKEFKEKVERGMTDRVASRLEAAEAALGEADSLLRQPLVGDPAARAGRGRERCASALAGRRPIARCACARSGSATGSRGSWWRSARTRSRRWPTCVPALSPGRSCAAR